MKFIVATILGLVAVNAIRITEVPITNTFLANSTNGNSTRGNSTRGNSTRGGNKDHDSDSDSEDEGAEMLDVGMALAEAMDQSGKNSLNMTQLEDGAHEYIKKNGLNVSDEDFDHAVHEIWNHVNTNNDTKISRKELMTAIFHGMDMNGDGKIEKDELIKIIRMYAKFLHVKLQRGW